MPSYPTKSWAAVLDDDGNTPLKKIDLPKLLEGEALIELVASGVCSGEAMGWYVSKKPSRILGHEVIGRVHSVGLNCRLKIGDRVFPHHHAPCGNCDYCKKDLESNCKKWKTSKLSPGGFSQYFVLSAHHIDKDTLVLPDDLESNIATFIEPVACCYRAMDKASLKSDDRVLIIGLGIMGLLNVSLFSQNTNKPLIATDFIKERRQKALEVGAALSLDPSDGELKEKLLQHWDGHLADTIIVGPSSAKAIESAIPLIAPGGRLVIFAPMAPDDIASISFNEFYFKEASIHAAYSAGPLDTRRALSFVQDHKAQLRSLISHEWPLNRVGQAIKKIQNQDPDTYKIVITPPPTWPQD